MTVKERPGSTPEHPQYTLYCDCCSERDGQGMAYWDGETLVITRDKHGRRHTLKLTLDKLGETLKLYRIEKAKQGG